MKKVCAILMAVCLLLAGLCPALAEEKTYTIGICQLAPHPALKPISLFFHCILCINRLTAAPGWIIICPSIKQGGRHNDYDQHPQRDGVLPHG